MSFNPRTRVGCDLETGIREIINNQFQSTHPRGVRRPRSVGLGASSVFQSTHPRGVRHCLKEVRRHGHKVSIHAPAWGATADGIFVAGFVTQFQSTHPRGVRRG